ncbi:MAG: hypothetical protein Q8Q88_06185 [Phenylobacterium sp.]|uniref:hypothetical protein n=1 Tax=Phenylobacterium sp. TaxID=1871053 RepID=UPI00273332DC|nr:hypothetical protein [Phenylobacterium sp.]MDP3746622.1 hypothetical protein [Phenylobacterium sp.]
MAKGQAKGGKPAPSIYLATPAYGGLVYIHYAQSQLALQAACASRGVRLRTEMIGGEALIQRGRARLLAKFLNETDASHILFCDADIGFSPDNLWRLLKSGHDVVGGVYPAKTVNWEKARAAAQTYVVRFLPNPDNSVQVDDGFARVAYCGTGFLLISRKAARAVLAAHPELTAKMGDMAEGGGEAVMVFDTLIEPVTGEYLSEDYAFCRRWRDLGGEVWVDLESPLTHVGTATFAGAAIHALRKG